MDSSELNSNSEPQGISAQSPAKPNNKTKDSLISLRLRRIQQTLIDVNEYFKINKAK
jgi:hypothetical protein